MASLYETLGVSRSATAKEIASAYRKLARKHHPDRNPDDPRAEAKFKQVSAAYEVLSDAGRRAAYDEFGDESLQSGFDLERARAFRDALRRGASVSAPFGAPGPGFTVDAFDVADLFGAGLPWDRVAPESGGADLRAVVELDLPQAISGVEVNLELPAEEGCHACRGSGADPRQVPAPCAACAGTGQQRVERGRLKIAAPCPACRGTGVTGSACSACGGSGRRRERRSVRVRIPPGADHGSTLRIPGQGAPGRGGAPKGDLVIETRVRPHAFFRRQGLDLYLKLPVTLDEAYDGAEIEVHTFTGTVRVRIPAGSQPGTRLRLRGKGVVRGSKRGDLYAELDVRLPERRDERVAEALRGARSAYARPVREEMRL